MPRPIPDIELDLLTKLDTLLARKNDVAIVSERRLALAAEINRVNALINNLDIEINAKKLAKDLANTEMQDIIQELASHPNFPRNLR